MLSTTVRVLPYLSRLRKVTQVRTVATSVHAKKEGTIADSFASLSGQQFEALEPRFARVKSKLIKGHEEEVKASWDRLLLRLRDEVETIKHVGSAVIPQIDYNDIGEPPRNFSEEYRKRGCAIVKGVIEQSEVAQMKSDLREYVRANPQTKDNPQVFELYWSRTQIRARAHPNLLKTQQFLLSYWHSKDSNALISSRPITYCDRLRMRQPGDAKFALGPHIDGGSCERWEEQGYGKGEVYDKIWKGKWEEYDPWESSCRLPVNSDLYQGQGACSAFRMAQGWLSMSQTSAFEGTLLVNPLLQLSTAYMLLRPFFTAKTPPPASEAGSKAGSISAHEYLSPDNWTLESPTSSWLQGANLGRGQELSTLLHPHLDLASTMIHVPTVQPGDYVVWHCDGIHAVDSIHQGKADSSVLYIPACPLTVGNAAYLHRQRQCFLQGTPSPDFPGGVGESSHVGVATSEDIARVGGSRGLRAMGLERWNVEEAETAGEQEVMRQANEILDFV
ncbi:hypothetical protein AAFC00_006219 [Neodothiora populina]|uniref:DUF1479-domain-containing protein n=1 Tax=Neodothiora populina TaxID=2781224 RepID=A0ABR3P4P9_9PEZI